MKNRKLEDFGRLPPARFRFLTSLSVKRQVFRDGADPFQVSLTLVDALSPATALDVAFDSVKDLQIGELGGLFAWHLEIDFVQDHRLEGISYRVVESENDAIRFWCQDFVFNVRGPEAGAVS